MSEILLEIARALGILMVVFFSFRFGKILSQYNKWSSIAISLFWLWLLAEVVGRNTNDPGFGYFTFFIVGIPYFAGFLFRPR